MKQLHRLLLCIAAITSFLTTIASAQNAQIATVLQMSPNPSPYLSDWQSRRETVTLIATLDRPLAAPVKLMAQIKLNGALVAETDLAKMPPIYLQQGINTFTASDLIPYHAIKFTGSIDKSTQRLGRLPEGIYDICVLFKGVDIIPPDPSACYSFTIIDINPPQLLNPPHGAQLKPVADGLQGTTNSTLRLITLDGLLRLDLETLSELGSIQLSHGNELSMYRSVNQPESTATTQRPFVRFQQQSEVSGLTEQSWSTRPTFQWLPPMPFPQTPVRYRLRVVEVLPGQTPEHAFKVGIPVVEKTVLSLSADSYGSQELEGASYGKSPQLFVWGVQATDERGAGIGKNNGWSAPHVFEIGKTDSTNKKYKSHLWKPDSTKYRSHLWRPGDSLSDPDFDLLRESFFDVFETVRIDSPKTKEPCPYTYKELVRTFVTPCKGGTRSLYEVWKIVTCSLPKGHTGSHSETAKEVTVKKWTASCTPDSKIPDGATVEPEPPKDQVSDKKVLDTIPSKSETDKRWGANTAPNFTGGNNINQQSEKCPFAYKRFVGYLYVPTADGKLCKYYKIWDIFRCTLPKGHAGDHHGVMDRNYELIGTVSCPDGKSGAEPPKDKIISREDAAKIPTEEEATKADAGRKLPPGKEPCTHLEKKLLRTVVGPWRKVSTTVRAASWRETTVGWVDVVWQRDMFNVFEVRSCTLEKGHAGAHKLGPAREVKELAGTFTEKVTYEERVPQVPPKPHATDSLPEE